MEKLQAFNRKLVVIGGGPAGMAAALEAKKQGIDDILIVERDRELGGILIQCIHAGFGLHLFGEELTGPEYAQKFINEIVQEKIEYITNSMVLQLTKDKQITLVSEKYGYCKIQAEAVILAMGCRERTRGALNIPGTRPAGVITAGAAQRFVNIEGYMPGREVVILGSGDIGLIMARRLTLEGAKVKMVCELMPYSSGLQRNIAQCLDDFDIPLKLSHTIVGISGIDRLESVTVAKVDEKLQPINETEEVIPCDTLLLSVGLLPENELTNQAEIEMDNITSGAAVNESMMTSVDGIFACGNVLHVHDLVDFVTKEAYRAGYNAALYILCGGNIQNIEKPDNAKYIKTNAVNGVRYIVPQKLNADNLDKDDKLFFRVDKIYRNHKIVFKADGEILKSQKKQKLAPGEMETVTLDEKIIERLKKAESVSIEVAE